MYVIDSKIAKIKVLVSSVLCLHMKLLNLKCYAILNINFPKKDVIFRNYIKNCTILQSFIKKQEVCKNQKRSQLRMHLFDV